MSYRLVKSFYPTGSFNPDTEQAYEFVTGSSATDYIEFGIAEIPLDFINNNNPAGSHARLSSPGLRPALRVTRTPSALGICP